MEEINYKLCIHKLTPTEQKQIDAIGWFAVTMYCERELSHLSFGKMSNIPELMKDPEKFELFLVKTSTGTEIGRFARTNNTIAGLIIYAQYRRHGALNTILEYINANYEYNDIYTSNKYLASKLLRSVEYDLKSITGHPSDDGFDLMFTSNKNYDEES